MKPTLSVLFLLFVPPIVRKEEMEEEQEGTSLLVGFSVSREKRACYPTENSEPS
jgi:hypothetical protein